MFYKMPRSTPGTGMPHPPPAALHPPRGCAQASLPAGCRQLPCLLPSAAEDFPAMPFAPPHRPGINNLFQVKTLIFAAFVPQNNQVVHFLINPNCI